MPGKWMSGNLFENEMLCASLPHVSPSVIIVCNAVSPFAKCSFQFTVHDIGLYVTRDVSSLFFANEWPSDSFKGCSKTVPLHTTLPANPRHRLGADSKTTPVGLCSSRSQVTRRDKERATNSSHIHAHRLCFTFGFILCIQFSTILCYEHHILRSTPQAILHSFSSIWT